MPDMSGRTLGKYRLIERLGRGGMAEVYRAYQPNLDRDVAIKVMHDYMIEDEEFVGRFGREAKAVASLHHPHVVQVYDFDIDDGVYYMVMEYVSGETLKARLKRLAVEDRRMPLAEVARIFRALCDALDYAHAQGCVHRDIKPANVMFEGDRLVLTDFGLAAIAGGTRFTVTGAILGTPAYMSPEQGRGEPGDVRSDIYALGVVLYETVTGQVPYDADTPLAIVYKHLNEPLPMPTHLFPDLSPAVEKVILKALAKHPDDRFQSAGALGDALEAAVAGVAQEADEPRLMAIVPGPDVGGATTRIVAQPARRRRWLPWALGGGVVLVVATLVAAALIFFDLGIGAGTTETGPPVAVPGTGAAPVTNPPPLSDGATDHSQALAHYDRGVTILFEALDPERALPEFAQAINLDPEFAEAYHMRGVAHQMMGQFEMAEQDFDEAIARKPDLVQAYVDRGRLYMHDLNRGSEAMADFDQALEINPELAPAYVERAQLYLWHGQEEQAMADVERALELNPDLPLALTLRGEFHYSRSECDEAIPDLTRSVDLMPDDPWPWEMLGQCYLMLGQHDRALDTYDEALRVSQSDLYLYYGRAFVYLEMGEAGSAIEDFERVLRIDSSFVGARYGRGQAYAADGRYEEAIVDFTWVIENGEEDEYIWPYFIDTHPLVDRAMAYYELERVDQALADLNALVAEMPGFHIAHYHRGLLYRDLGRIEEAKADFEEAWRQAPNAEWQAVIEEELNDLE